MLANAAAYGMAAWGAGRRISLVRAGAGLLVAVNLVLTLTDQMGFWDYCSLALNGAAGVCWMLTAEGMRRR